MMGCTYIHVSPDLKVDDDFQLGPCEISGTPPESMWCWTKSSEGSREPFVMCPGALKSRWFDLSEKKRSFSKKFFFRDIFFTWRFLRPCFAVFFKRHPNTISTKNHDFRVFPSFGGLITFFWTTTSVWKPQKSNLLDF